MFELLRLSQLGRDEKYSGLVSTPVQDRRCAPLKWNRSEVTSLMCPLKTFPILLLQAQDQEISGIA